MMYQHFDTVLILVLYRLGFVHIKGFLIVLQIQAPPPPDIITSSLHYNYLILFAYLADCVEQITFQESHFSSLQFQLLAQQPKFGFPACLPTFLHIVSTNLHPIYWV